MQPSAPSTRSAPGDPWPPSPAASWEALDLDLPVGLYRTDPAGGYVAVNARWSELSGLTAAEALADGWVRALHPDDRERVLAAWAERIATGHMLPVEYRFRRPDDGVVWVLDQAVPHRDAAGVAIGYGGSLTDITERKRNEETSRTSEERFRALATATAAAIWTIDATGDLLDAPTNRWPYLTDLPAAELAAEWLAAVHPDDRAPGDAIWWAGVAAGRPFEFEQRVRQRDGSYRHFAVRAVPVRAEDGTVREWVGADVDVTDRRRAEAELRDRERFITGTVNAAPGLVYVYDLATGRNRYVNDQLERLFGWTRADIAAMGEGFLFRLVHPDDAPAVARQGERCATLADGEVIELEYRFRHKNGAWRWVRSRDTVFARDGEGRVTQALGLADDVTDRRRAEDAVRVSEERLRQALSAGRFGTWRFDLGAGIGTGSERTWEIFGRSHQETITVEQWTAAIHPDDRSTALHEFEAAAAGDGVFDLEYRLVRPDGQTRWVGVTGSLSRDAAGNPVSLDGLIADITPRREAEAALRASEERYRTLVQRIDQGFCVVEILYDADGGPVDYRFLEVNPTFERHTGLKDAVGRTARELVPNLEQQWVEAYARAAETGAAERFEQGSAAMGRWFEVEAVRVGGEASRKVAILFADVSQRKQAEAHLRESERRLQTLANAMPQVVWVADPDGTVLYYNDRVAAFAGVRQTASGAWDWQPMLHPDDLAPTLAAWEQAVRERAPYAHEHRIRMADGEDRWHLSRAHPVLDPHGEIATWYGTATDIHEIKEAERELEQRRREFETLVEHSPDIVCRADRDLRFRYVNPAIERVIGIPAAHVIGKTTAELGVPADVVALTEEHARAAMAERRERYVEFTLPGRDGERHLRTRLVPEVAPDGSIETLLAVTYDVTERVRAEVERQTLLDALAHDLKNPLAALKAQAQVLRRQIDRRGVPDAATLTARVAGFESLATRMTELVDELGDHARLAMGQPVALDPEPTDLVALVRDAVAELRQVAGPHRIDFDAPAAALIGVWDARRLRRVAANLLSNAVKYSPGGGEVVVRLWREDGEAVLEVRDEGIGIPAADLPRVFEFRRRAGNVGAIAGSGIGLAGAKRIVEQHGGTIAVASAEGRGSTFTVRLPLAADPPGGEPPA